LLDRLDTPPVVVRVLADLAMRSAKTSETARIAKEGATTGSPISVKGESTNRNAIADAVQSRAQRKSTNGPGACPSWKTAAHPLSAATASLLRATTSGSLRTNFLKPSTSEMQCN
jgi:hypothetical protein